LQPGGHRFEPGILHQPPPATAGYGQAGLRACRAEVERRRLGRPADARDVSGGGCNEDEFLLKAFARVGGIFDN
jgi:hypothetical protein